MYSMTGFGKGEVEADKYSLSVELKSVNHRFKDMRFKMGQIFNSSEMILRKEIEKNFKRGSFDIFVSYKKKADTNKFDDLDSKKIEDFILSMKGIAKSTNIDMDFRPCDFLRNEFVKDQDDEKETELKSLLDKAFTEAVVNLKKMRKEEGDQLKKIVEDHINQYEEQFKNIEKSAPEFEKMVKERVEDKFKEYSQAIEDEPRYLQEVIYYLEKMDIHEEINRINAHLGQLRNLLDSKKEVGRQIDFLLQELNRETNTIGSKSNVVEISDSVVKMKSQLEKIREQALNIE